MWKTLLVLAVTTNSFFISPSEGSSSIKTSSSSWSNSSSKVSTNRTSTSSSSYSGSSSSVSIKDENSNKKPSCTQPNEVYDVCPAPCPPQRCDVDPRVIRCAAPPKPGDAACKPGCRCVDGYVRNNEGLCVTRDQCPPKCGVNEMYDTCANGGCRRWNCSEPEICIDPLECKPGCVCKNNYTRADNGTCIPENQCEYCFQSHEYYDDCAPTCPPQTCESIGRKFECPAQTVCQGACRCLKGYHRNKNGDCVTEKECKSQCANDERFEECPDNLCTPQTCSQLGFPINCPALSGNTSYECPGEPGCVCDNDKVRDDDGNCIPKDQCPSCGGDPYAVSGCGINCGRQCSNYKKKNVACPLICKLNSCDCRKGYVFDNNVGKCVLPENCTPVCYENEIYSNCSNGGCGPRTCDQVGYKIGCVKMDQKYCQGGCICQDGYVRDDNGKCIPKTNCPECGGDPNAVLGCGVNCGRRCSDLGKGPVSCIEICYEDACDCRKGFVLDDNTGQCVFPENCTATCGINEVYDTCANSGCRRWNCSQPTMCIDPLKCEPGCVCKNKYSRADNGTCIPEEQCDQCLKSHEYYDACAPTCPPQTCDSIGKIYHCPAQPLYCRGACRCEDGYYRNATGDCISEEECEKQCPDGEMYEECPDNLCSPQSCSQLGFPIACPALSGNTSSACPGEPGCICDNDKVRDDDGNCIPKDQCPSCGGDPNAIIGCGINCGRRCSNYKKKNVACPLICKLNSCDCRNGYVYDDNLGKCVLPKDCTPTCGINEIYDTCANGGCRRWNCSEPVICIDPFECKSGCICKNNYSRDDNGICIPVDQCAPQCANDERYEDCPGNLCTLQKCSQLGFPLNCTKNPDCPDGPGCICDNGYVRNDVGNCIPINECPSCGGDPNAQSGCGNKCGKRCSDYNKKVVCGIGCIFNGCNCREGFVYDDNIKKCVRPNDCTPMCSKDEVYSECINGGCQRKNCSQLGKPVPCIKMDPKYCIKGCLCKDGYLRDDNGTCILEDQCTPSCGPNERYDECPDSLCSPQKCSQLGFPIPCVAATPPATSHFKCPGKPGCICVNGYVRNDEGICIPSKNCPSCGGDPNAVSGCGVNCGKLCSNYDKGPVPCPKICKVNACDCRDGFVLDQNNNKCVHPTQCTPICGDNEVYSNCTNGGCQAKNCPQLGKPVPCVKLNPKDCIKGCLCKDGYLRADNGTCIPEDKCKLQCNKPHEYYVDCAPTCPPQTCDSIGQIYFCPKQPPDNCKPACRCEDGYYRNENDDCVTKEECGPQCADDEKYDNCPGNLCTPQKCSELGFSLNCTINSDSKECPGGPGCICNDGNVRDDAGNCIPIDQCPSCGGDPNAQSGCSNYCGNQCSDYNKTGVACPLYCLINGCDCKDDFVYDNNLEQCVRPEDCTPICGNDEVYSDCVNGGCQAKNCSQLGKPIPCVKIDPKYCIKGCLCKDGYLRADNGTCILENQCKKCNKPNEYYDECAPSCPPQTCESIGKRYSCPKQPPSNCKGACRCKKGYYRNVNEDCVTEEECEKCTGPHEYFACGSECDNVCATLNKQNQTNCPIINIVCNSKCYCENGYARDDKKICIPIDECPAPLCADDETYDQCPGNLCVPLKCSELGFPLNCTDNMDSNECPGGPGCICDDGKVTDDEGNCIPIDQCPSCGGDPNAQSGCGSNCGRRCSDYNKENVACPFLCLVNGCDCRDGFVYDDNLETCVRPEDCTPSCGQDEVYSDCTNGGCQAKNCSQLGQPIPCVKIDPKDCIKGCLCKDGYLRADNGTCIPQDQCEPKCKKLHEYYDACAPTCPPQTCESIGKKYNCPLQPAVCNGACRCEKGYYRNKLGECITAKECKKCSGPHEYFSCGGACDNVCATLHKQNQTNCPIINVKCNPMCYCEDGYARNNTNVCIPIDQCPPPKCGNDQKYVKCPAALCEPLTCSQVGFPIACPDLPDDDSCPGAPDCVCKNNYVKNVEGNCISRNKCPSCGGDPNAVYGCGNHCGKRCSDHKVKNKKCSSSCGFNACDCKKGFVYDDNLEKCVRPKDCTPICKDNEVYEICANGGCLNRNCSQLGQPTLCIDPIECKGGCVCKKGYLRANNGTCLPEALCPGACKKPHEMYDPCPPVCPPQTCDSIGKVYSCPFIPANTTDNCRGDCRCEDGYYRNKIGECISEKDCLKCTDPNEYFSCGKACDNVCATLSKQNKTNCPIINKKCSAMCYCEDGYARDKNNVCIPIDQCDGLQCADDETYDQCPGNLCVPLKCSELGFPLNCTDNMDSNECPGGPGCICDDGKITDDQGNCIPIDQCPSCGGDPNAQSGCGSNCGKRCSDYNKENVACPFLCLVNGCDCRDGFVYDDNLETCVRPKDCTPSCGQDEVYSDCTNGGCQAKNCSQLGQPIPCVKIDPKDCIKGCLCKDGYLRADNGTCIPQDQCEPICKKLHEYYDACAPTCPPQTCESIGKKYNCPLQPAVCNGACRCEKGYYRNKFGECITAKECKKCSGPHEYFSCGGACDNVCATLHKQNQTNCPIINVKCNPMCYCEDGYARNNTNVCIPIDQCPPPSCGQDEVYSDCTNGGCQAKNCSQLGQPIPCVKIDPKDCIKGCLCKDGYLRADNGTCIPQDQCKPKCKKPHEYYDACAPTCPPQTCESIGKKYNCPLQPAVCSGACRCVKGYYRNKIGECITAKECTSICTENEVYNECINGGCQKKNCSQLGKPNVCVRPKVCKKGCLCKDGYLRHDNGTCVPINQCSDLQCGRGERYVKYPSSLCEPLTCAELGFPLNCSSKENQDTVNKPACICKEGYVKDDRGKCVPKSECPSCGGDSNAMAGCGVKCGNTCSDYGKKVVKCKEICNTNGCDCKDGFIYNEITKKCVKKEKCNISLT